MSGTVRQVVAIALAALLPALSHAVVVDDLYTAEVSVSDHTQQALSIASRDALSEVLVKVSGSVDVLENPSIASAVKRSRSYVQQYAYSRDEGASGELFARFEFDRSVVSKLVTEAGVPFWTANRPSVLVWMIIETPDGREFLNFDTAPEVMAELTAEFARRGVPVQFPLYDLNDAAIMTTESLWQLTESTLQFASTRYRASNILAGRLVRLSDGRWVGDWSYLFEASRIDRSIPVGPPTVFLQSGVSLVAQEMSSRYAVASSPDVTTGVTMRVSGVSTYSEYARIVSWLEEVELIEYANVETISADEIQLNLVAQADAKQLAAIIELNEHLLLVPSRTKGNDLSYKWQN